jgi:hypothetical protein
VKDLPISRSGNSTAELLAVLGEELVGIEAVTIGGCGAEVGAFAGISISNSVLIIDSLNMTLWNSSLKINVERDLDA